MEGLEVGFITSKRLYNSIVLSILLWRGTVEGTRTSIGCFNHEFPLLIRTPEVWDWKRIYTFEL
jgi:hypothetical protein